MDREEATAKAPIVIAEDDDLSAQLVLACLKATGYEVVRARDGEEAVEFLGKYRPQLLVLDMDNGLEVTRLLGKRPDRRTFRILVLTVQGRADMHEKARSAGADDVLAKPFLPEEFVDCVRQLLGDPSL